MPDAEKTVFISYRRSTGKYIAAYLFNDLRQHGFDVFWDISSIDSGPFDEVILHQIAARMHFLVILTPGTLERCADPDDWLRREIEHAMTLGRNIVPITLDGFDFNEAEGLLTGQLAELTRYNAVSVPYEYLEEAMTRLRTRFLKAPESSITITPPPASDEAAVQEKISQAVRANKEIAVNYFHSGMQRARQNDLSGAIADYQKYLDLGGGRYYGNQAEVEGWIRDLKRRL
jgi:hypothetical protein